MNKMSIGIAEANKEGLYGNLIMVMAIIPKSLPVLNRLKIKDIDKLSQEKIEALFKKLKDKALWQLRSIKPYEIDEDIEMKRFIDMINSVPKFWEHKIFIKNWEKDKESFIKKFNKYSPINLKKLNLNLNEKNWGISNRGSDNKASILADIFARYYWNEDLKQIKMIYGSEIPQSMKRSILK